MKFLVLIALFSLSALAGVTPAQMKEIRKATYDVMYAVGAEPELNATLLSVKIVDELGSRVKVKFVYEEAMYGKRTCSYYYDLKVMAPVNNSALCEP